MRGIYFNRQGGKNVFSPINHNLQIAMGEFYPLSVSDNLFMMAMHKKFINKEHIDIDQYMSSNEEKNKAMDYGEVYQLDNIDLYIIGIWNKFNKAFEKYDNGINHQELSHVLMLIDKLRLMDTRGTRMASGVQWQWFIAELLEKYTVNSITKYTYFAYYLLDKCLDKIIIENLKGDLK